MQINRSKSFFAGSILFLALSAVYMGYLVIGTAVHSQAPADFWSGIQSVILFLSIWLLGFVSGRRPAGKVVVWRINAGFQTYLTDKPEHAERFKADVVAEYTHK